MDALRGRSRYMKVTFGYIGTTLVAWWSHFGCIKVGFQKIPIFPTDFNDFIKHSAQSSVTLGSLWDQALASLGM